MPTATYSGHSVVVNDEGFLVEPAEWTEDMAPQIAKTTGTGSLHDRPGKAGQPGAAASRPASSSATYCSPGSQPPPVTA